MVLRVNREQRPREAEEKAQPDVITTGRKLGEDQAAASSGLLLDRDAATSSPCRIRAPVSASAASSSPLKAAASARDAAARSSFQPEPPSDHRPQLDAAAAVFASLPKSDDTRASAGFVRPAAICINTSGSSPSQDRPRGWQAMLQSPTQPDDQVMSDVDQQVLQLSPAEPEQQPLPVLSPAADTYSPDSASQLISSSASAAAAASAPAASMIGGPSRPSPLILPDNSNGGAPGSRFGSTASPASRFSALRIASPASSAPAAAAVRPFAMARPDLRILPPPSPCDAGCITPTALQSPSRPYSGPPITEADVDYDLIDGIAGVDGSNPVSSSSSPNLAAAAGSAVYTRSGGLRSSRDTDLRRMAMTNQLLHSPRPPVLAVSGSGPQPMFTGETRARALNSSSNSSATPTLTEASNELMSAAAAAGEAGSPAAAFSSDTPPPDAVQLQRLYQQTLRGSQLSSPASTASPAMPSILATTSSSARSLPATPSTLQHRSSGSAAAVLPSSSRSSSMSASPVPPPSQGPAAALLAGAVGASPRTPRSPLSVIYSPYSGRTLTSSVGGPPLPLPLFMMNSGGSSSAAGSPLPAGSSAALPPSGRTSLSNIGSGLFSPPHLSSRLRQENSGMMMLPTAQDGSAVAAAVDESSVDRMDEDVSVEQQQQQQQEGGAAVNSSPAQQAALSGGHYPQMLRQRLQVTDTRYGPHGESPLSPSHHTFLQQLQQQQQQQQQQGAPGESLLSPTRPTPRVQPAPLAAAAGNVEPDAAADAAAATAAGRLVGDVGRRDVHEWLDQHSWSFLYGLPHNLRDAADFARNQRRSSSSRSLPSEAAVAEGYASAQQQQGLAVPGGTSGDWLASISQQQQQQQVVSGYQETGHNSNHTVVQQQQLLVSPVPEGLQAGGHASRLSLAAAAAAAGSRNGSSSGNSAINRNRPLHWAFGDLRVSVDQSGPGPTAVSNSNSNLSSTASSSSSSSSRLGPLYSQGLAASSSMLGTGNNGNNLGVPASSSLYSHGRSSRAVSHGGFRHSTGNIGEVHFCAGAGDSCSHHSGIQVVADSRLTHQLGPASAQLPGQQQPAQQQPAQQMILSAPPADTVAAASSNSSSSSTENLQPGAAAVDISSRMSNSSSSGSSSRLLCPGSHRYLPGSPLAQHSCCCSCTPVARTPEGPQIAPAAAAAAAGVTGEDVTVCGSSATNNAAAAAELIRSSMAAVAAAAAGSGGHMKTPDACSRCMQETSNDSSTVNQRDLNALSIEAAAEASSAVELSPATPTLHVLDRLLVNAVPSAQQQQQEEEEEDEEAAPLWQCAVDHHDCHEDSAAGAEQQQVLPKQGAAAVGAVAGQCAFAACSSSRSRTAAAGESPDVPQTSVVTDTSKEKSARATGDNIDTGGMLGLICGQMLLQQQQQGHLVKVSAEEEGCMPSWVYVLLSLLHDEQYMAGLLSSLPGVDPLSPEVKEAVQQLRGLLQLECRADPGCL